MKLTKKEIEGLKREVKTATGENIKDIESIEAYGNDFIVYGYYRTNYDKAIGNLTKERIAR